jgi:CRISPR-associated endonuclease Cas2
MFLSISTDFVTDDSQIKVDKLLKEYGIKKIQHSLYESFEFPLTRLGNLKKELGDCLDMDDKLRMYQYPLENTFKISYIENRKWKRLSISQ